VMGWVKKNRPKTSASIARRVVNPLCVKIGDVELGCVATEFGNKRCLELSKQKRLQIQCTKKRVRLHTNTYAERTGTDPLHESKTTHETSAMGRGGTQTKQTQLVQMFLSYFDRCRI
jgi:hypothetical protein